jgi:hypothetical protein
MSITPLNAAFWGALQQLFTIQPTNAYTTPTTQKWLPPKYSTDIQRVAQPNNSPPLYEVTINSIHQVIGMMLYCSWGYHPTIICALNTIALMRAGGGGGQICVSYAELLRHTIARDNPLLCF